jgi:outer membrane protein OmpA-like peptidoglycan-associated protein
MRAYRFASLACALISFGIPLPAFSQQQSGSSNQVTTEDIVRSLLLPAADLNDGEVTRSFKTRSILPHDPKLVKPAGVATFDDQSIHFALNSASLDESSRGTLAKLAEAMADPRLEGQTFGISGHTDALGDENYNLELSRRRAESVQAYLITNFGIESSRLFTNGHGKAKLLNKADPLSAENRRVEIRNLGAVKN